MSKTTARPRVPGIACPHCNARSIVRSSEQITDLVRELRVNCDNDECGHTFVVQLSIIRTIRESATPNPSVHLPFGGWYPRPANDDRPLPANDDRHACADAPAPPPTMLTG